MTNFPLTKQAVPELAGGEQNGMAEALDRLEIVDPDQTAPSFTTVQMWGLAQPRQWGALGGVRRGDGSCSAM